MLKNRYTDVLCYDHTRVLLAQIEKDSMSDYIHANFVDGYKQKNAFISTQGPLPHTCADFWRMIWEQQVLVIVMTTKVFECGKIKCEQYWPPEETSDDQVYQHFKISTISISQFDNYAVTRLEVTNTNVCLLFFSLYYILYTHYVIHNFSYFRPTRLEKCLIFVLTLGQILVFHIVQLLCWISSGKSENVNQICYKIWEINGLDINEDHLLSFIVQQELAEQVNY